jgi:signal transduction histidine kinase
MVVFVRQQRRLLRSRVIMAERKRMADDIHDTIEQHLVGAGMLVRLGRLKEAQDVLARAKREVRDVVWGLKNDDMMRLSPAEMLRQIAHDETTKGICRIDTRVGMGLPLSMDAAKMRDLSLMVREAIGNAIKHGGAKKIAISSDPLENGGWMLRVANDGVGFNPETSPGPKEGHFGLEGMRQRARRIGAEVSFSEKAGWTIVSITATKRV